MKEELEIPDSLVTISIVIGFLSYYLLSFNQRGKTQVVLACRLKFDIAALAAPFHVSLFRCYAASYDPSPEEYRVVGARNDSIAYQPWGDFLYYTSIGTGAVQLRED